jgi:Ca2+-transporting ATPase
LLPVQILWMNLVTDGVTAVALGVEPPERTTMHRPPRDPAAPILGRSGLLLIVALGSYLALGTLFLFQYALRQGGAAAVPLAQTVAFTGLVIMQKMNVFNFRSMRDPLGAVGFFTNPWLLLAVLATFALQLAAVYVPILQVALQTVPLGWGWWGLILLVAAPVFLIPEAVKGLNRLRQRS